MRSIPRKRIREFFEQPGRARFKNPLLAWARVVESRQTDWTCFADVRETFPHADQVGRCVVFNIAGNHVRLIADVNYSHHRVDVTHVMTRPEYDRGRWRTDCV